MTRKRSGVRIPHGPPREVPGHTTVQGGPVAWGFSDSGLGYPRPDMPRPPFALMVLGLVLVVALLGACSGGDDGGQAAPDTTTPAPSTTAAPPSTTGAAGAGPPAAAAAA